MRLFYIAMTLFIPAIFFSLQGCSDSVTNSGTIKVENKARTERDFQTNADLKADPAAVIYSSLEHLNTPAGQLSYDTGIPGEDIIPYHYSETTQQSVRVSGTANLKARLISDASGAEIYNITPSSVSVTVTIPPGDYKLYLTSLTSYGSDTLGVQEVFIQNDTSARDADDLSTLIATGECFYCNLDGADLSGLTINPISLSFSSLINANFSGGRFLGTIVSCNFTGANLSNANFASANLLKSNFTNAILLNTNLAAANLGTLNFSHANLRTANLRGTIITNSIFSNADLSRADMSNSQVLNNNFCGAIKTGLISTQTMFRNNQCWP